MNLPWGPRIEWVDTEMSLGKPLPRLSRRGHLNTIFTLFFSVVCYAVFVLCTLDSLLACQAPLSMGILQARILEWLAIPSSTGFSQPRSNWDRTQISHTAGRFFTIWATREVHEYWRGQPIPSRGSSQHRNWTRMSCITGGFFTEWATREAPIFALWDSGKWAELRPVSSISSIHSSGACVLISEGPNKSSFFLGCRALTLVMESSRHICPCSTEKILPASGKQWAVFDSSAF